MDCIEDTSPHSGEKRGSNPPPLPWQGSALPLSYFRTLALLCFFPAKELPIPSPGGLPRTRGFLIVNGTGVGGNKKDAQVLGDRKASVL